MHTVYLLLRALAQVLLLSGLEHPNIVRYLGTSRDEARLYIFLEYVPVSSHTDTR